MIFPSLTWIHIKFILISEANTTVVCAASIQKLILISFGKGHLVCFYSKATSVGYLRPKPFLLKNDTTNRVLRDKKSHYLSQYFYPKGNVIALLEIELTSVSHFRHFNTETACKEFVLYKKNLQMVVSTSNFHIS